MNNIILSKENTFCISLESATDRWEKMSKQFERMGLDVTRWIASTPSTITDNFMDYLLPTVKACSQSHINIWRHILLHGLDYALIMEDDACFSKRWREAIDSVVTDIDDMDWDILFLYAPYADFAREHVKNKWTMVWAQHCTTAYIISKQGIRHILNSMCANKIYPESDSMTLRLQYRDHSYGYFPNPVTTIGWNSTILNNKVVLDESNEDVCKMLQNLRDNYYYEND